MKKIIFLMMVMLVNSISRAAQEDAKPPSSSAVYKACFQACFKQALKEANNLHKTNPHSWAAFQRFKANARHAYILAQARMGRFGPYDDVVVAFQDQLAEFGENSCVKEALTLEVEVENCSKSLKKASKMLLHLEEKQAIGNEISSDQFRTLEDQLGQAKVEVTKLSKKFKQQLPHEKWVLELNKRLAKFKE